MIPTKLFRSLFTNNRLHTVRLGLDALEQRANPAGTVTGSLVGTTWTLSGDAEANDINIEPTATPGEFVVTGNNTTVAGVTSPTGVQNIVVRLFRGADSVTFNSTNTPGTLAGNLTIHGGIGANYVYIQDMTINGNVSVTNLANVNGSDEFYLEDSTVKGRVVLNNGEGSTRTEIYRTAAGYSYIGQGVSVTNGTGRDVTYIVDYNLGGNVTVRNNRPDNANEAGLTQMYNRFNTTSRSLIRGNVTVSYAGGTHSGPERDGFWDREVMGNVLFNYGRGAGDVRFDGYAVPLEVLITGNLNIVGGGPMYVAVANQGYQNTGMQIGGQLSINTGNGADTITAYRLSVNGRTLINTYGGADNITIDDSRFRIVFNLNTGAGADTVNIETTAGTATQTQFLGRTIISLGLGDDQLTLGFTADPTSAVEFGNRSYFFGNLGDDTITTANVFALFGDPITVLA